MAKTATKPRKQNATSKRSPNATHPSTAESTLAHALQLSQAGRFHDALAAFDKAIDKFGPRIEFLYNRGVTYQRIDLHADAIRSFVQIVENTTRTAPVHFGLGVSYQALGETKKALRSYDHAISLVPTYAEALQNRGIIRQSLGLWDEAIADHRAAIEAEPTYANAHNSLGAALHGAGRDEEALEALARAMELEPRHRDALNNRGICLHSLGRHEEAVRAFDEAIALAPNRPMAYANRSHCLADMGLMEEAERGLEAALTVDSRYAVARFNRSLLALRRGDFEAGWRDYEFRSLTPFGEHVPINVHPTWDGRPMPDGTIYVRAEQGAGDTIQFLRYLPLVKERCREVVLECQPNLVPLAETCAGIDRIVTTPAAGQMLPAPAGAVEVFLLSLPGLFRTDLSSIPDRIPYVSATERSQREWKNRILLIDELARAIRIGIVWAGSPGHKKDRIRSCRLEQFTPLTHIPGVKLFSLQKGAAARDLHGSRIGMHIADLSYGLFDYGDTAGAIEAMDLVVTVDTSVAHLAGALGKPVFTLLATNSDWRWMADREDSPWYPSMQLFRQHAAGDWDEVIERVVRQIVGRFQTKVVIHGRAA